MANLLSVSHLLFAVFALICPAIAWFLLGRPHELATARWLQRIDRINAIAATLVLVIGLLRLFLAGKGFAYYVHNPLFITKLVLYGVATVLSLVSSLEIKRWAAALKAGALPLLTAQKRRHMRMALAWQFMCVVGMMVCATLVARGFGAMIAF